MLRIFPPKACNTSGLLLWCLLICFLLHSIAIQPANAQAQRVDVNDVLVLPRINAPIEIDGKLADAGWESIEPFTLTAYEPVYRDPMSEKTEIRVGYDDRYLYVGGHLYDSDHKSIRANSMYRDQYSGDDTFAIILDTFNDSENALWFATTPNGIRLDLAVTNDLQGGGPNPFGRVINVSWNTFWDVATTRNEEGWYAEMRIPFSSLGFQNKDGIVEMGMSTHRYISRKNERHIFPDVPPNWNMAFAKPSTFQLVRLEGAESQRPIYITPYATAGASQQNQLVDAAYQLEDDFTPDVGIDLKYNVTSNLTMDLTVNTDFAQAEADDQQVNLTRFSLFFPEKRQFFQERAGIFEFRTQGRFDRLFHTRQIGLNDGETIPIIGGARLVGRVGQWDVGLINMQTARSNALPSENFGVYRLRRQVFNENSYAGGIFTTRLGDDGSANVVYGLDGIFRVSQREYLEFKWAQTFSDKVNFDDRFDPGRSGYGRIRLERRGEIGLSYATSLIWQGENFDPGIGFVSRTDFVQVFNRAAYGWFAKDQSSILSIKPGFFSFLYFRNTDGSLESGIFRHDWDFVMKSGDIHTVEVTSIIEDLTEPLDFPEDTQVPVGKYDFQSFGWQYAMRDGSLFRTNAEASVGSFYDGWNIELQVEPTWNVSRNLELGAAYQFNRVRFPDWDQEFFVHLARIKAQIGFTTKISLNSFIQYNTADDAVSANVRFRYNFSEGNDLWIVYNEGRHTDRFRQSPVLPRLDNRTVLLKYTYTFIR